MIIRGPKLRVAKACQAFVELADACGFAMAVMPLAKGLVPVQHPHFIETYYDAVGTAFCGEIVESVDAYLFAGPIFNDYSSIGYSLLLKREKAIIVQPDRVVISHGPTYGCVLMKDFLHELAKKLKRNTTAYENYKRLNVNMPSEKSVKTNEFCGRTVLLFRHNLALPLVREPALLDYSSSQAAVGEEADLEVFIFLGIYFFFPHWLSIPSMNPGEFIDSADQLPL
ncbi:unnamed protein product [Fraxinus pennsylvanica]|uniref:pyruvate decarboxylase n=1 Tax=Fraxinus pennsylvanica TaxID=56036 RepID=A0AAD1YVV0_9LAMI|nr:unnamed protein product [Fraxinus pennsylvanica]